MTVYRLDITSLAPLHRGIHGHAAKSGAVVHSDTLHAALVSSAAAAGARADDLERFRALRVSSLFPSLWKAPLYPKPFLPLPKGAADRKAEQDPTAAKRWKQVRLVSEKVLNAWLLGRKEELENAVLRNGAAVFEQEFPEHDWPRHGLVNTQRQTGVAVDRDNAAATPYDRSLVWVNKDEGVGLYCFVEAGDKDEPWLQEAFERLGYAGLGGNRTSGFGAFEVESCENTGTDASERSETGLSLRFPDASERSETGLSLRSPDASERSETGLSLCSPDASERSETGLSLRSTTAKAGNVSPCDFNMFMTLSLYLPTRAEVDAGVLKDPAAYDCTLRGGWIHGIAGTDRAKHALRLCVEGSVFNKTADRHGEVRDVAPEGHPHPVWRSGLAFALPFQMNSELRIKN